MAEEHIRMRLFVVQSQPGMDSRLVPTQEARTNPDFVYIRGEGDGAGKLDLTCGNCDRVLVEGIPSIRMIQNIVFECPSCGVDNRTRQ